MIPRVLFLLLLLGSSLSGAVPPLVAEFALPDIPTAAIVGTEGTVLNPAALYVNKPISLQFYHSFAEGSFSGDNAFMISTSGVGFSYQRLGLEYPEGVSRYDFALSSRIVENFYSGLSYTYYKTDWDLLDKAHSWNYSFLWHADRALSISAQLQNLNRNTFAGEESAIGYLLGLALRPMQERLTIGGDVRLYGGQKLSDAEWHLRARGYLKEGLAVFAGISDHQRFGIGIEMQFGQSSAGLESFFSNDNGYERSTAYGIVSASSRSKFYHGKGRVLSVDVSGPIPEEKKKPLLFWREPETLYQKLRKIRSAGEDPAIKGLLLRVGNAEIGWSKLLDLRNAVLEFRASGKPVVCYLGTMSGMGDYYLASAADSIFMAPLDGIFLTGLRAEVRFYAGTLEKLEIEPEIEKVGKYKTAPNQYTEKALTPEHRESLGALLDDIYSELIVDIARSRNVSRNDLESVIDMGPFNSSQAESLGLIDARVYPGELPDRLPASLGGSWGALPSEGYLEAPAFQERFGGPPEIMIIPISGEIVRGESRSSLLEGEGAGSSTISAAIRRCARDRTVKAIVMRLDTPGGDALASDLIWGELMRAKTEKPVVVSMSDICASGGYYIASAADRIFLEPTTITGSIGVYAGKVDLSGFNAKLGISTETLKRGKHAAMFSLNSPFSQEERQLLRDQVSYLYRNFVSLVSDNRNLSFDSVDTIARGRVWSGTQALNLGLADDQGSLLDAVAAAAEMAHLDDGDYRVTEYVFRDGFPRLPELVSMSLSSLLGDWLSLGVLPEAALISEEESGTPQYRLPYDLKIK